MQISDINTYMQNMKTRFDAISKREQIIIVGSAFLVFMIIWDSFLYKPMSAEKEVLEQNIATSQEQITDIDSKISSLTGRLSKDNRAKMQAQVAKKTTESSLLDEALSESAVNVIRPEDMAVLLQDMLKKQKSLTFIALESLPLSTVFKTAARIDSQLSSGQQVGEVYRHGMVIRFSGKFDDILSYIETLEKLPWQFFWEGIDIEVQEYPTAQVTMELYTLGLDQGWIGV